MKILVCGGRDFTDASAIRAELLAAAGGGFDHRLIHGCARGADSLARDEALRLGWEIEGYPADWSKWGKAAGSIRNRQMLSEGRPDLVIAMPGGRGTADMVRQAKKAGIPVREVAP